MPRNGAIAVSFSPEARPLKPMLAAGCIATMLSACTSIRKEPWETAPLPPGNLERIVMEERGGLVLERFRFFSKTMEEPRFFLVLSPAGGPKAENVVILNHGWFDRPEDLLKHLKLDSVYSELVSHGSVNRALLVMPDIRFADYFRKHSEEFPFPHYLSLVAEEIAGIVSKEYEVQFDRERWGIGGFSFGGFVSLDIVRRYAGRFGSASVISSFADEDWEYWPQGNPPPGRLDSYGRGKQTIVVPGPLPRLFLACGESDRFYKRMVELHELFERDGVKHDWSVAPGGHDWDYWSSVIRPMLLFHLSAVATKKEGTVQ